MLSDLVKEFVSLLQELISLLFDLVGVTFWFPVGFVEFDFQYFIVILEGQKEV